jgi:hypothetical protein
MKFTKNYSFKLYLLIIILLNIFANLQCLEPFFRKRKISEDDKVRFYLI